MFLEAPPCGRVGRRDVRAGCGVTDPGGRLTLTATPGWQRGSERTCKPERADRPVRSSSSIADHGALLGLVYGSQYERPAVETLFSG